MTRVEIFCLGVVLGWTTMLVTVVLLGVFS
jgi:hypothetical protein